MMKNIFVSTALVLTCAASSNAAAITLSDFFQDWTLSSSQGNCASTISAIPGDTIPGVFGMPGPGYDDSQNIRFRYDRGLPTENEQVLTLGKSGNSNVTLNGNVLSATMKSHFLFFSKTKSSESFTLGQDGSLTIANGDNNCLYSSAHPALVGKVETGASLLIGGVKVAECTFVPASPRPDQVNFIYNEACDLGKYTSKQIIDTTGRLLSQELAPAPTAPHDLVIVRSTQKLNGGTENWLSLDGEIMVQDDPGITLPPVDDIIVNNSEYFISPYETSQYTIYGPGDVVQSKLGTPIGVVQIEYANQ